MAGGSDYTLTDKGQNVATYDSDGRLVPPGTYIYRLLLDIKQEQDKTGIVSVAY